MEVGSHRISKDKKLQCFLTQIPKEDIKVHFESNGSLTPANSFKFIDNTPIASVFLSNSKSEIRSVEGRRMKTLGINHLKSILKENKEVMSSKKSVNKENREQPISKRTNKYYRISINEDELKPTTQNSYRGNQQASSKLTAKKGSINQFLQRSQTEAFQQKKYKNLLIQNTKNMKRMQKRRKCRITTHEQFEDECTKYLQSKQKEETDALFRQINRQMILHQKRKEPNNYYQRIRKSALKKIDYMSYNQKYYDDAQVKHLFSVVDNCNILIHKRSQNQGQKFSKRLKTERFPKDNDRINHFQLTQKRQTDEDDEPLNRTSISAKDIYQLEHKTTVKNIQFAHTFATSKTVKISRKQKIKISKKISDIVGVCEQERKMLEEVKNGMKIFQFYCNRIDAGFANKGKRLNNFILGEDQP